MFGIVVGIVCLYLFQFVYESEKHSKDADILKEINKGIKLNHVKCNDRSKPNLKGRSSPAISVYLYNICQA